MGSKLQKMLLNFCVNHNIHFLNRKHLDMFTLTNFMFKKIGSVIFIIGLFNVKVKASLVVVPGL